MEQVPEDLGPEQVEGWGVELEIHKEVWELVPLVVEAEE